MKDRLVTPGYCFILAANFLLYFGFWLLIPVLPFYLSEVFNAGNSTIGIILSCYTVAALCIRPFSGYFLDSFARKPLYLLAYFIFMTMFAGYIIAGSLTLFILFRIIHGVSFGMVTVGGNTVVIDHGCGLRSYLYGLDALSVSEGQSVERGQAVGALGEDLTMDFKLGSKSVNPWLLFQTSGGLFWKENG